jgi:hypothetical protein
MEGVGLTVIGGKVGLGMTVVTTDRDGRVDAAYHLSPCAETIMVVFPTEVVPLTLP